MLLCARRFRWHYGEEVRCEGTLYPRNRPLCGGVSARLVVYPCLLRDSARAHRLPMWRVVGVDVSEIEEFFDRGIFPPNQQSTAMDEFNDPFSTVCFWVFAVLLVTGLLYGFAAQLWRFIVEHQHDNLAQWRKLLLHYVKNAAAFVAVLLPIVLLVAVVDAWPRLGHILGEVAIFWLKIGFVFATYQSARDLAPATRPSTFGTLIYYAKCVGVVAIIGFFACGKYNYESEGLCVRGMDYTKGAIVFLVLLGPALFGAAEGLKAPRESKRLPPPEDDWPVM